MFDIEKHAGVGRVGAEIKDGLIKRGYDVVTMALNNTNHLAYSKYVFLDIKRKLPKADVYIAQSPMESIWLPKHKTIAIVHDLIPLLHPNLAGANMNANPIKTFLGSRVYWFGAYQASRCKRIVVNSQMTKDELIGYFKINPEKVRQYDLGVRPDLDYKPKQDNVFRIGYLGQLDRRKRVNLLIEAFKETDIDGELVIGGSGPDKAKLQELAGDDKRIKFLGFVPDDKLCDFYNSLSLFCFPTAVEGWGIPIVEAMACKKPVLILRNSIIPAELKRRCEDWVDIGSFPDTLNYYFKGAWDGSIESNYQFAHSLKWSNFVDGVEKEIKEVANG